MLRRGAIGLRKRRKRVDFDAKTLNYKSRLESTSGVIRQDELAVVDFLVTQLVAANLWEKITFLWVPLGSFPHSVLTPIKHPRNSPLINVNNGLTSNAYRIKSGMRGNLSGWLNTQTTEADYPDSADTHIALYLTQLGTKTAAYQRDIGTHNLDRFQLILAWIYGDNTGATYYRTYTGSGVEGATIALTKGFYLAQRNGATAQIRLNGSIVASSAVGTGTEAPNTTNPIAIFQAHNAKTDRGYSLVSIGKGFTNTEAQAYSTIVAEFQARREALFDETLAYANPTLDLLADRGIANPVSIQSWEGTPIAKQSNAARRPSQSAIGSRQGVLFNRNFGQYLVCDAVQAAWQAIYIIFRLDAPTFSEYEGIFIYQDGGYSIPGVGLSDERFCISGIPGTRKIIDGFSGGYVSSQAWLNGAPVDMDAFHFDEEGIEIAAGWNVLAIARSGVANTKILFLGTDPSFEDLRASNVAIGRVTAYEEYSEVQRLAIEAWAKTYYNFAFPVAIVNSVTPASASATSSVVVNYDLRGLPVRNDTHISLFVFPSGQTNWSAGYKNVRFADTNAAYSSVNPVDPRLGTRTINLNGIEPGDYIVSFSFGDEALLRLTVPFTVTGTTTGAGANAIEPSSANPTDLVELTYDLSELPVRNDTHISLFVFPAGQTNWSSGYKNVRFADTNQPYSSVNPIDPRTGTRTINLNGIEPGDYIVSFSFGDEALLRLTIPFTVLGATTGAGTNRVEPTPANPAALVTLTYDLGGLPVRNDIHIGIYVFPEGQTNWSPGYKNVRFTDTNAVYSSVNPTDPRTGTRTINLNGIDPGNYVVGFSFGDEALLRLTIPFAVSLVGSDTLVVAGFGDSITFGYVASNDANKWLNLVASSVGSDYTINSGIPGSKLQHDPNRTDSGIDRYQADILGRGVDVLYALYGFNDITDTSGAFTAAQFKLDLIQVVQAAIASGIAADKIYLGTPPRRAAAWYDTPSNLTRQLAYNAAVRDVAKQFNIYFADVYTAMVNDGRGDALLYSDGLHPVDSGMSVIAQAFLNANIIVPSIAIAQPIAYSQQTTITLDLPPSNTDFFVAITDAALNPENKSQVVPVGATFPENSYTDRQIVASGFTGTIPVIPYAPAGTYKVVAADDLVVYFSDPFNIT